MRTDDETTPPVNSFGAARATARELAAIKRGVHGVRRLVWVAIALLVIVVALALLHAR